MNSKGVCREKEKMKTSGDQGILRGSMRREKGRKTRLDSTRANLAGVGAENFRKSPRPQPIKIELAAASLSSDRDRDASGGAARK